MPDTVVNPSFLDSFLGEESVKLPTGGGAFLPTGLIGPLTAGIVFRSPSWYEEDLAQKGVKYDFREESSGTPKKYRYYWLDPVMAKEACDYLQSGSDRKFQAEMVWRLEMPTAKVMSFADEEFRAKFTGDSINYSIVIVTPRAKRRFEFHLLALPFAVQATALMLGLIKEPIFNASELLSQDTVYDDAFEKQMIGDPDKKTVEGMLDSELGRRRIALWNALGETNAAAYTTSGDAKVSATAPALVQCLRIVEKKWAKPIYAEVSNVFSPHMKDYYESSSGEKRRNRIAVITRFFNGESDAKTAADELIARIKNAQGGTDAPAAVASPAKPLVPTAWVSFGEAAFIKNLKEVVGLAPAIAATKMGITADEFVAWKPFAE